MKIVRRTLIILGDLLKYSVGNGYGGDGGGNGRARVVGDSSGVVKFGGVFHGPRNRLLI